MRNPTRKTFPIFTVAVHRRASSLGVPLLLVLFLLTMTSGCTSWREYFANGFKVGPKYCPPAAPVAKQWLDAGDPAVKTSPIQDAAWWRTFNDPVLDSLIATAYRQNLTVRVAGLRILEARALRGIAAGNLFPQDQAAIGDYTRNGLSKNSTTGGFLPNRFFDEWTAGATLAWELDFWGRFRRALEAADANLDASVENYDNVLVLLLSDVAQSYANIRIAEQRLAYAQPKRQNPAGQLADCRGPFPQRHHHAARRDASGV
jgi:outer membrane protein TolC